MVVCLIIFHHHYHYLSTSAGSLDNSINIPSHLFCVFVGGIQDEVDLCTVRPSPVMESINFPRHDSVFLCRNVGSILCHGRDKFIREDV